MWNNLRVCVWVSAITFSVFYLNWYWTSPSWLKKNVNNELLPGQNAMDMHEDVCMLVSIPYKDELSTIKRWRLSFQEKDYFYNQSVGSLS